MARYISLCAQVGNLGDVVIRRNCLRALVASHDEPIIAFAGDMPNDYIDFFDIDKKGVTVVRSPRHFLGMMLADLSKGNSEVVMAPAPFVAGVSLKSDLKHQALTAILKASSRRGNSVLVLGRAVRGKSKLGISAENRLLSAASTYVTRDTVTRNVLSQSSNVYEAADMAFYDAPVAPAAEAHQWAISLRFDRPLNLLVLERAIEMLRQREMKPIFVSQVKMDVDRHDYLAQRFGVEHLTWPAKTGYVGQYQRVMNVYAQSAGVLSDRLHALVFGMLRSAVPVAWCNRGDNKLLPTVGVIQVPHAIQTDQGTRAVELPSADLQQRLDVHVAGMREHQRLRNIAAGSLTPKPDANDVAHAEGPNS